VQAQSHKENVSLNFLHLINYCYQFSVQRLLTKKTKEIIVYFFNSRNYRINFIY